MAITLVKINNITRSEGRSAVASAAYHAAEKITNDYDGVTHDFTKKKWVLHKEIRLPNNAPRQYFDRSTLWNELEKAEKSTRSQLAKDILLVLPNELNLEQQIELVREYVDTAFVSTGMCADIAIHNPPVINSKRQPIDKDGNPTKNIEEMTFRNPHVHILLTLRPMDENGKWEQKRTTLYLAIKDGVEKEFTPNEMKQAIIDGWEKQYHYEINGKKYWLPKSDTRVQEIKPISNAPKQTKYGKLHPSLAYWNRDDIVMEWRYKWVDTVNAKFIQYGTNATPLDARSYKDQGRVYEVPLNSLTRYDYMIAQQYKEKLVQGTQKDELNLPIACELHQDIRRHNQFVKEVQETLDELSKQASEIIERLARQLESIRCKIINNHYLQHHYNKQKTFISEMVSDFVDAVTQFESVKKKVAKANQLSASVISDKKSEFNKCSFYEYSKKEQLQTDILEEEQKILNRKQYLSDALRHYHFSSDEDYEDKKAQLQKQKDKITLHDTTIEQLKSEEMSLESEYKTILSDIPKAYEQQFQNTRKQIRREYHSIATESLQKHINSPLELATYNRLAKEFDKLYNTSSTAKSTSPPEKKPHLPRHKR